MTSLKVSIPRGLFAASCVAVIAALTPLSPVRADAIARISVETAHLRSEPDQKARTRALLDHGDQLRIVDRKGSWCRVVLSSGTTGWVRSDLVSIVKVVKSESAAEKTAAQKKKIALARKKQAAQKQLAAAKNKKLAHEKAIRAKKQAAAAKAARENKLAQTHKAAEARRVAEMKSRKAAEAKKAAALRAAQAKKQQATTEAQRAAQARKIAEAKRAAAARRAEAARNAAAERAEARRQRRIAHGDTAERSAAAARRAALSAGRKFRAPGSLTRGNDVVRTAMAYRGTPYRFGARSENSFDCSGFTSYLFEKKGKPLPRTAAEQFNRGSAVSKDNLRPGDLVFFKNTYKRGVSHVGIYVGDNKFIHASSAGGKVEVDSLNSSYYTRKWAGARRQR